MLKNTPMNKKAIIDEFTVTYKVDYENNYFEIVKTVPECTDEEEKQLLEKLYENDILPFENEQQYEHD